jgi:hypothetical protein
VDRIRVRFPGRETGEQSWINLEAGKTHVLKRP